MAHPRAVEGGAARRQHLIRARPARVVRRVRARADGRRRGVADRLRAARIEGREIEVVATRVEEDARIALAALVELVCIRQSEHRAAVGAAEDGNLRPRAPVERGGFSQPRLEVAAASAPVEADELRTGSTRLGGGDTRRLTRIESRSGGADV